MSVHAACIRARLDGCCARRRPRSTRPVGPSVSRHASLLARSLAPPSLPLSSNHLSLPSTDAFPFHPLSKTAVQGPLFSPDPFASTLANEETTHDAGRLCDAGRRPGDGRRPARQGVRLPIATSLRYSWPVFSSRPRSGLRMHRGRAQGGEAEGGMSDGGRSTSPPLGPLFAQLITTDRDGGDKATLESP
jgi:hypothetical protein